MEYGNTLAEHRIKQSEKYGEKRGREEVFGSASQITLPLRLAPFQINISLKHAIANEGNMLMNAT